MKVIDIKGQRFGWLIVLKRVENSENGTAMWLCLCDCGNKKVIYGCSLRTGRTRSCGCLSSSGIKKGRVSGFFGKNHTEEWKQNKSKANKGKNNPNCKKCGVLSSRYDSTISDEQRYDQRQYPKYDLWREAIYKRDKYLCQYCGQGGGKLNAHHLESYTINPGLRTTLENGATLCVKCHKNFHHNYGNNSTAEQFNEFMKARQ